MDGVAVVLNGPAIPSDVAANSFLYFRHVVTPRTRSRQTLRSCVGARLSPRTQPGVAFRCRQEYRKADDRDVALRQQPASVEPGSFPPGSSQKQGVETPFIRMVGI